MNRLIFIAIGICVVLSVYMLTGLVGCGGPETAEAEAEPSIPPMRVEVREMEARVIPREVRVAGRTEPSRHIELKAETAGQMVRVAERRGEVLAEGDWIAEIDLDDRRERLEQARAALEEARLQFEAAKRLQERELRSAVEVAAVRSQLRGAEQLVRLIELDIAETNLTAPFEGILQERHVEVGDYVAIGDPVAHLIDLDPLVVAGQVTEFQRPYLHPGEVGTAQLASGETVSGTIRYVAGQADPLARTFRVELEVDNPGHALPAGVTAELAVETEQVHAHRISPGFISIADDGRFGVKIVDPEDRVVFVEADIVKTEPDALWLTGLPEQIRLITIGQGFTQEGDRVEPVSDKES